MAGGKDEKQIAKRLAALARAKDAQQRLVLADEIRRLSLELQRATVAEARQAGLTWTQIGELFGMSKQAAQQRFKDKTPTERYE